MIIKQHIASATGLAKFISVCDAGLSQARVGDSVININTRDSNICFKTLKDAAYNRNIFEMFIGLEYHVSMINRHYFNADIDSVMDFQFAKYDSSSEQHYDWHCDEERWGAKSKRPRKLSIIIGLNGSETNYTGGEIQFKENNEQHLLKSGECLVFPSYYYHRVLPVTEGVRYSLVSWITGPQWR